MHEDKTHMKQFSAVITWLKINKLMKSEFFKCWALRRQKDNKNKSGRKEKYFASFYHLDCNDKELVVTTKAHRKGTKINL